MHGRQAIRDAIKATLLNNTACGASVFENRSSTLTALELPAIVIASETETSVPRDIGATAYVRKLTLLLEIRAQATADSATDDALDNIALQIETKLRTNNNLGGIVFSLLLTGTTVAYSADGDSYTGHMTMTYEADYIF